MEAVKLFVYTIKIKSSNFHLQNFFLGIIKYTDINIFITIQINLLVMVIIMQGIIFHGYPNNFFSEKKRCSLAATYIFHGPPT